MPTQEHICSEVWGNNGNVNIDLVLPGLRGVLYSRACGGKKGGDVYYASACMAGIISRAFAWPTSQAKAWSKCSRKNFPRGIPVQQPTAFIAAH